MNLASIPWDKLGLGAIAFYLLLQLLVKEILPVYFKARGKSPSAPPSSNGTMPASKGDMLHLSQRMDKLESTVGEIRDWMLLEKGKASVIDAE